MDVEQLHHLTQNLSPADVAGLRGDGTDSVESHGSAGHAFTLSMWSVADRSAPSRAGSGRGARTITGHPRGRRRRIRNPGGEIVAYAGRAPIGLIVVGTHGRTGASRAILGAAAEAVVRQAPCRVRTAPAELPEMASAAPPAIEMEAASSSALRRGPI